MTIRLFVSRGPLVAALVLAAALGLRDPQPAVAGGIQMSARVPAGDEHPRYAETALIVTTEECHEAKEMKLTARAEGIVDGKRRSIALTSRKGSAPGLYEVSREWPASGRWILVFQTSAWAQTRTMVVPVEPSGLLRVDLTTCTWDPFGEKQLRAALSQPL